MKRRIVPCLVVTAAAVAILAAGCSPTGWAVKELPDGSDLQPGEEVTVIQHDGSAITGRYIGTSTIPWDTYFGQYDEGANSVYHGGILPAISQTVQFTLSLSESKYWTGQLAGFDLEHMWAVLPGSTEPQPVYFSSIKSLSAADGSPINRTQLRGLFVNGDIPFRSALRFRTEAGEVSVPISSIKTLALTDGTRYLTTIDGNALRESFLR